MKQEYMKKYGDFFCNFWQVAEISKPTRDSLGRWGFTIEVNNLETATPNRVEWVLSLQGLKFEKVEFSTYNFYEVELEAEGQE
jgi:hypothetical protein